MRVATAMTLCLCASLLGCAGDAPAVGHQDVAVDLVEFSPTPVGCNVSEDGGLRVLSCSDGTVVSWSAGNEGAGCTVTTATGLALLCEDGSGAVLPEIVDGSTCTVTQEADGSATLRCSDGTSLALTPGADEPPLAGGAVAGSASRYGDLERDGIRVTIVETDETLLTNAAGEFVTAELPVGYYTLRFESDGYAAETLRNVGVLGGNRRIEEVVLRRGTRILTEGNLELTHTAPTGGVFLFQRFVEDYGRSLFFEGNMPSIISTSSSQYSTPMLFWRNDDIAVIFENPIVAFEPTTRRLWSLGNHLSDALLDPSGEWLLNGGIRRVSDGSLHPVSGSYLDLAFSADSLTLYGRENATNVLYAIDCASGVRTKVISEPLSVFVPSATDPDVVLATARVALQTELVEYDLGTNTRTLLLDHSVSELVSPRTANAWVWQDVDALYFHDRATRATLLLGNSTGSSIESPGGDELLIRTSTHELSHVDLASQTTTVVSVDYERREPLEDLFVNDDLLIFRELSSQPSTPDGTLVVYELSTQTRAVLTEQASTDRWQVSPSTQRIAFRTFPSGEVFVFDRATAQLTPTGLIAAPEQWLLVGEEQVVALAADSEARLWSANLVAGTKTLLDDSVTTLAHDGQSLYYTISQPTQLYERRRDGLWTLGALP